MARASLKATLLPGTAWDDLPLTVLERSLVAFLEFLSLVAWLSTGTRGVARGGTADGIGVAIHIGIAGRDFH